MNLNNVDFNKLRVFSLLVENQSCTVTAEELNLTRSAVSQSLASLERSLNRLLFHRIGRRLEPTEFAVDLYGKIRPQFLQIENELLGLQSTKTQKQVLRIGTYSEFAKSQLVKPLQQISSLYPNLQVRLLFDSPSRLQTALDQNKVDLCFSIYPIRNSHNILCRKIFTEEMVLIAAPGMMSSRASREEILARPVIDYFYSHQLFKKWFRCHFGKTTKAEPRYFAATADMVIEMVKSRMGVAVVPSYLIGTMADGEVAVIRPTSKKMIDHLWMCRYKEIDKESVAFVFSNIAKSHFDTL